MTVPTISKGMILPHLIMDAPWTDRTLDENLDDLVRVLGTIRFTEPVRLESEIVDNICAQLDFHRYPWIRESKLVRGSRVDILVGGIKGSEDILRIGIEVKKGKPNTGFVRRQLKRYAESGSVNALILVTERGLRSHIEQWNGIPIKYVSLAFNWGVSM